VIVVLALRLGPARATTGVAVSVKLFGRGDDERKVTVSVPPPAGGGGHRDRVTAGGGRNSTVVTFRRRAGIAALTVVSVSTALTPVGSELVTVRATRR